jgi:hypothetical protein
MQISRRRRRKKMMWRKKYVMFVDATRSVTYFYKRKGRRRAVE